MSYIRIWIHLVFGTKRREKQLTEEIRKQLITHIVTNCRSKNIFIDCINGYSDHLHLLISLSMDQNIAKIAQLIKGESSFWVNSSDILRSKFEWADEYFAVSIGEFQIDAVRNYIKNQEEHHRKKSFAEEYDDFIKKYKFRNLNQSQN